MTKFLSPSILLLLLLCVTNIAAAQHFKDMLVATDAYMVRLQDSSRIENTLSGATLIIPKGLNEIRVRIPISHRVLYSQNTGAAPDTADKFHLMQLTISVDPFEIQNAVTSTHTFVADSPLTLNKITKNISVRYLPIPDGTNNEGKFRLNLIMLFNASDFDLKLPGSETQILITINNAHINRI